MIRGTSTLKAPPPIKRPKLAQWLWERGLVFRDVEADLGRSYEYIRQVCLPFSDPARKQPDDAFIERAESFTAGEVTRKDFDPPETDVQQRSVASCVR